MPFVFSTKLQYLPCAGAVPGTLYIAPGTVIAVAKNGHLLSRGIRYSEAAGIITLTIPTEEGDRIDALCLA